MTSGNCLRSIVCWQTLANLANSGELDWFYVLDRSRLSDSTLKVTRAIGDVHFCDMQKYLCAADWPKYWT